MGTLIDPRNQQIRFLESEKVISLQTCRKNLLCVDVVELLQVEQEGEVKEEIYMMKNTSTHENGKRENTEQKETNEDSMSHPFCLPHTCMTKMPSPIVQKSHTTNQHAQTLVQAAESQDQSRSATGKLSHRFTERCHGPPELSRGGTLGGRGPRVDTECHLHECSRCELQDPPRNSNTGTVGTTDVSHRKESRQDVCPGLRRGRRLPDASEEPQGSVALDEKLPELPPSQVETSSPATNASGPQKAEPGVEPSHAESHAEPKQDRWGLSHRRDRVGEAVHTTECILSQERPSREGDREQVTNEDRAKPGQDRAPPDADCRTPTRTGTRDTRPRGPVNVSQDPSESQSRQVHLLSESQVAMIHESISNKMTEIQGGLSNLRKKHTILTPKNPQKSNSHQNIDLLEVYCGPESQLTHQINRLGGRAIRFTKGDGDLSTKEGIGKLWTWIEMYEPNHIWVAPECRLWGSFAKYNMGRSPTIQESILRQRKEDVCHLELCNELYLHQVSRGKHFHLEQPYGSEMTKQPQLSDVVTGTLPAFFDMCQAGKLRAPNLKHFLRKRTQVLTTSRSMHAMLHSQNCTHDHTHQPIQGSVQGLDHKWIKVSAYAAAYTAVFARKIAQGINRGKQVQEKPLLLEELLVGEDVEMREGANKRPMAQEVLELRKCRRRHDGKSPPTEADLERDRMVTEEEGWKRVVALLEKRTPRVGNAYLRVGDPEMERVQEMVPEVEVRLVIMCRGTERHRVPNANFGREDIPLRKMVYVHRQSGKIVDLGAFEEWERMSKAKQVRKAGPARISASIFGRPRSVASGSRSLNQRGMDIEEPGKHPGSELPDSSMDHSDFQHVQVPAVCDGSTVKDPSSEVVPEGWAPKIIPVHGPAFLRLSAQQRSDLSRLHNNLGHPDPARLRKLLEAQGADPAVIAGAEDMQCDVCLETQPKPKLPNPSSIHNDLDFNDVVGADGAYWKSGTGETYHFMHFIDEGTLFHVGMVSGRTTEEQISTFEKAWLMWAGPCKTLYLDPAGEYISPLWNQYLQKENIRVTMAAGDSHWQIGKAEIHGKIIKDMLTRMDKEEPIQNMSDFQRCLRQAFAAKNSLSRAKGFTPEQALLGKSRSLPASLTSDDSTSAHALAESDTPEGVQFRNSLQRREQARRAFIQADNDSACRRALLRRSRPGSVEYGSGDWVLYWKKTVGNQRGARGRWHGPAQVITVEQRRVVWLSHGGYLIRASPQHLRPASLREYRALPRDVDGRVRDEVIDPKTRNFHALTDVPPDDVTDYEPSIAPTAEGPQTNDQPEQEVSPPLSASGGGMGLEEENDYEDPSMIPTNVPENGDLGGIGVPVPMDDEEDDSLICFGDDIAGPPQVPGLWEIEINDVPDIPHKQDLANKDFAEMILVATTAKKQRVEVKWRDLNEHDRALFRQAKDKEVRAWIEHDTVERLAKGSLPPNRIMRCRWILSWKPPLPDTTVYRPKARLVILGFEDPDISVVPNDAPTLSKDEKQLILQKVSSNRWPLLNFDISTAFLKGEGDGRELGIYPPPEISSALGMKEGEQCGLQGGAYGRIDGPYLWYQAFKRTLEELGFVPCPLDGCVFALVTPDDQGKPWVRGVLGIHVDDGLGGGDEYFMEVIGNLRQKYSFGAFNIGEFDFCGIRYRQLGDGSIELCQKGYVEHIEPIQVQRHRRKTPQAPVTESERQCLRQLCGSLQYAAVQTRPDICAKVGLLQSAIPRAHIEDLLEANRVLLEAKNHPVTILVVPIPEDQVAFCGFSDASFETKKGVASRQGTIVFTTDGNMAENQLSVICPIAWSSRKIPRVVRSTLSAEASALSSTLDRVSWLRIMWAWLKDPGIDWTSPTEILQNSPLATIATDCKSVYDLSTKTSTPTCEEFRTTLECLLIRERLSENCKLRWVSSQAMLADCLTKAMDGGMLRRALELGKYALFDELAILQQRADKRERLKWLSDQEKQIRSKEMSQQEKVWFRLYFWRVLMSNICCPLSLSLLRTIWTTWHLMPTVSIQTCHDWSCICRRPTSFQLCVHQCGGWARHLESKSRAGGSGIQVSWRSRHTSLLVSQYIYYIYIYLYIIYNIYIYIIYRYICVYNSLYIWKKSRLPLGGSEWIHTSTFSAGAWSTVFEEQIGLFGGPILQFYIVYWSLLNGGNSNRLTFGKGKGQLATSPRQWACVAWTQKTYTSCTHSYTIVTIDCGETVKAWCFGGQGEQQKVEENLTSALKARSTGRSEGETFETSCMAHGCYLSAPASDLSTSTCSCEDIWGAKLGALDISPWYMLHSGSPPRRLCVQRKKPCGHHPCNQEMASKNSCHTLA